MAYHRYTKSDREAYLKKLKNTELDYDAIHRSYQKHPFQYSKSELILPVIVGILALLFLIWAGVNGVINIFGLIIGAFLWSVGALITLVFLIG